MLKFLPAVKDKGMDPLTFLNSFLFLPPIHLT
jgi:hypothetical protein